MSSPAAMAVVPLAVAAHGRDRGMPARLAVAPDARLPAYRSSSGPSPLIDGPLRDMGKQAAASRMRAATTVVPSSGRNTSALTLPLR